MKQNLLTLAGCAVLMAMLGMQLTTAQVNTTGTTDVLNDATTEPDLQPINGTTEDITDDTTTTQQPPGDDDDGLSGGAIAGIVIGCVAVVGCCVGLGVYFYSKSKTTVAPTEEDTENATGNDQTAGSRTSMANIETAGEGEGPGALDNVSTQD